MTQKSRSAYYTGISGLVLPIPKYKFPEAFQASTRLTYYASLCNSIEINRSFYALPKAKTVAKWSTEVPENFKFTFKLWKQITHGKNLQFEKTDVRDFMNAIDAVGDKRGCLLIQFPASIKHTRIDQLQDLLDSIRQNDIKKSWKLAIEFRDKSWYDDDTFKLIRKYDATVVIHDKSKSATPLHPIKSKVVYLRFHGPNGDYRGTYSESFLLEYASYIEEWLEQKKSVFVYFNNTMGDAFNNLRQLNSLVGVP